MKILKELMEARVPTKKVYYGVVAGGRGGNQYHSGQVDFPVVDPDLFDELSEDNDVLWQFRPNNEADLPKMIQAVKAGKTYASWDSFGEGVFGIGSDAKDVKLAVLDLLTSGH